MRTTRKGNFLLLPPPLVPNWGWTQLSLFVMLICFLIILSLTSSLKSVHTLPLHLGSKAGHWNPCGGPVGGRLLVSPNTRLQPREIFIPTALTDHLCSNLHAVLDHDGNPAWVLNPQGEARGTLTCDFEVHGSVRSLRPLGLAFSLWRVDSCFTFTVT